LGALRDVYLITMLLSMKVYQLKPLDGLWGDCSEEVPGTEEDDELGVTPISTGAMSRNVPKLRLAESDELSNKGSVPAPSRRSNSC
jgi:hypothetical protein